MWKIKQGRLSSHQGTHSHIREFTREMMVVWSQVVRKQLTLSSAYYVPGTALISPSPTTTLWGVVYLKPHTKEKMMSLREGRAASPRSQSSPTGDAWMSGSGEARPFQGRGGDAQDLGAGRHRV